MKSLRTVAAVMIGLSFSAIGCGAEPPINTHYNSAATEEAGEEQPTGDENVATRENGIIVMNGGDPAFFWKPSTQQALKNLAKNPLEKSLVDGSEAPLLANDEGRALLEHVVACALPEGELVTTSDGVTWKGAAGLAPRWKSEPLDDLASSRWVTACLLQTLNGLGSHVPIRLEGSTPALAGGATGPSAAFTVDDATMFGDVFGEGEPAAFACANSSLADICDLSWSDFTLLRICGHSPTCGVTILGPCSLSCSYGEDGMPTCEAPGGEVYPESIASYLKETASLTLGQDCSSIVKKTQKPAPSP